MKPRSARDDVLSERSAIGAHTGFEALEQSLLECGRGRSRPRFSAAEEVLFVIEGRATLHIGGDRHDLVRESGIHLPPGARHELENPGPEALRLVAVRIPTREPERAEAGTPQPVVRRLAEQEAEAATAAREFRIIAKPRTGLSAATHFVGYIPPGRAPAHFHTYDEVIYVLEGEGVLHAEEREQPVAPGSCIQLPARTVHCLENAGGGTMRVVAVFRPAGSPAAAYYPDGTPAHGAEELLKSDVLNRAYLGR